MKKTFFLALIVLGQVASATTIRDTRLEFVSSPLRTDLGFVKTMVSVSVYAGGAVVGRQCTAMRPIYHELSLPRKSCKNVLVIDRLNKSEMNEIEEMIEEARNGEIVFPDPRAMRCLAIPTRDVSYTADNSSVLLYAGAVPCGDATYNNAPEAQQLKQKLQHLYGEYQKMLQK